MKNKIVKIEQDLRDGDSDSLERFLKQILLWSGIAVAMIGGFILLFS